MALQIYVQLSEYRVRLNRLADSMKKQKGVADRKAAREAKKAAGEEDTDLQATYESLRSSGSAEYDLFSPSAAYRISDADRFANLLEDLNLAFAEIDAAMQPCYCDRLIPLRTAIKTAERMIQNPESLYDAVTMLEDIYMTVDVDNLYYDPYHYSVKRRMNKTSVSMAHHELWTSIAAKFEQSRKITVFDPLCNYPGMIRRFSKQLAPEKRDLYGIVQSNMASELKPYLTYTALGSASKITNNVFDVLLLAPWLSKEKEKLVITPQDEKSIITRMTQYLRPGGWLALELPSYRYDRKLCETLMNYYDDYYLVRSEDTTDQTLEMSPVWFIGRKRAERPIAYVQSMLKDLYQIWKCKNAVTIDEIEGRFELPSDLLEVKDFRGSMMDDAEMRQIYEISTATKDFQRDQGCRHMANETRRPLLKFNKGQTALVLTSGCMDGAVDEEDGACHLIKGRIIKNITETTDWDAKQTEKIVVAKHENRVEINAWLPTGQYVTLA